jgi:hypothetical protein
MRIAVMVLKAPGRRIDHTTQNDRLNVRHVQRCNSCRSWTAPGLCAREEGASLWLTLLMARADLKALVDLDMDEAASIALDWRDEIDRLIVSG